MNKATYKKGVRLQKQIALTKEIIATSKDMNKVIKEVETLHDLQAQLKGLHDEPQGLDLEASPQTVDDMLVDIMIEGLDDDDEYDGDYSLEDLEVDDDDEEEEA